MANELRTRDGLPFNFVDGLRIKGVDVTNWDKVFIDQGASYVGFTPVGNLAASNVQAAIAELESEKQSKTEPITTAINLRPGANQGIVWDNDAFGGTQDTASITLETAAGEATKMRFKMTNDSDDNFEFTAKTADGLTVFNNAMSLNGNVLLNAANYVDYTAPMISDYAALRAYTGNAGQVRITSNGLAGFFYYDVADTTSVDNGGTIIVAGNGKRWKRVYSGAVNVKWFGAKGDWNGGTGNDNTVAIQSAFNAHYFVVFDEGSYKVTAPIVIRSKAHLRGSGKDNTVIINTMPTESSCIKTEGSSMCEPFTISDMSLKCTNGAALNITQGAQFNISNVRFSYSKYGLLGNTCVIGSFYNCSFNNNTSHGILLTRSFDIDFYSCRMETNPTGVELAFDVDSCYGIRFFGGTSEFNTNYNFNLKNCFDTILNGVWVEGGSVGVYVQNSARNTTISSGQFINQSNSTINGTGLLIDNPQYCEIRNNRFSVSKIVATGGRGILHNNYQIGTESTITLPAMPNLWTFTNQTVTYSGGIDVYKQMRNAGTYELVTNISPEGLIDSNAGAICVAGDGVYRKTTGVGTLTGWILLNAESKVYNNTNRPVATLFPPGYQIFNTSTSKPNYSTGTAWVDAAGGAA